MIHFKEEEFIMGDENVFHKMNDELLILLDQLRERVEEPLHITSSFRSEEYNKSIGGATRSMHLKGNAVDLACSNGTLRSKIVYNALSLGMSVGVAKSFVHVDNRGHRILFTY